MIKFLKNFFKLGQPNIYEDIENPKEPNEINTSWQYKRMRKYSLNNEIEDITNLVYLNFNNENEFINSCMKQSLIDGDLRLFEELFMWQRNRTTRCSLPFDNILDYGYKALQLDKKDIFESLLELYQSEWSTCVSYDSDFKVIRIMEYIIDNEKIDYFDSLKKYELMNFNSYITEKLDSIEKFPYKNLDDEVKRFTFVLDKFSDYINKKDLSRYLNYPNFKNSKSRFPESILEVFENFDFVKKKIESKKLFEELSEELEPSTQVKKPKKMKV